MKSKRWMLWVAGAFLGMVLPCMGQHDSHWRVYRAADGLPETFAASITAGQHGHLWVRHPYAEWIGLLDGYDVKAIPGPGLGTSRIYESASGQIWTCTVEGLERYQINEAGWIHYDIPELSSYLRTNSPTLNHQVPLYPMRQNHLLFLLPGGLFECNVEKQQHPEVTSLRDASQTGLQRFLGLVTARDGGLWISGAKGLAKIPGPVRNLKADAQWAEHVIPEQLGIQNLREPIEDDDGGVTAIAESLDGNRQVVVHFDGQKWSAQATSEKLFSGWRGQDGTCWASTLTGLLQKKAGSKEFLLDESIPARRFSDVVVETNGVFWLATSDGLFRYAPFCWRLPAEMPSLNSLMNAVAEDREDRLWVASASGLNVLHNEHWTNYTFPPDIAESVHEIRVLFALTNGNVAMESGNRLLQFDPVAGKFQFVNAPKSAQVKLLGLLKDGALCVGLASTNAGGAVQTSQLVIYDGTDFSPFPFEQPDLTSGNEPQTLCLSQGGGLWLSSRKGISRYHDKKWQTFTPSIPSISSSVACISEVSDGKIWCGIEDRIWEFDGNTWSLIRAGFEHVNAMLKAPDGSTWVASDNGLHRFFHGTWTANGTEEGLPSAAIRAVYQDHRGHLWAATTSGLCEYHPEADPDPPRTYVQNLPDRNNTVREGAIVNIAFSGADKWKYTPEDRLLYSYRLDGQDWSPYQEQRNVSFLDLLAGKHTFYVRSMDRNWNVDPKPAMLEFAVALPWYLETRLLLISAAGLGVALFFAALAFNRHRQLVRSYAEVEAKVALRTRQLELANQELFHSQKMNALGTLAAGIAHDFNNILSIIKGSAQIIETNLEDQDKIRTRTERIKTVVEQGAGIVKAMLGFSRTSDNQLANCDINAVVSDTIKLLGDRFLREVEVQFTPAPSLPEVPASKDFIQQILLNFIFNAAEAMTEKRRQVILSVAQSSRLPQTVALKPPAARSYVMISVKDFGTGIAPEIMPRIFEPFFTTKAFSTRRGTGLGLSMVYELARQMDGGLSVESAPGQGSVFTLILPVRDLPVDSPKKSDKLT
jgi:signal transduction histidine kinase/streptogramin lyase